MRKLLYLCIVSGLLYSCKPDQSNGEKISTDDPKAVSAAIKIWHGAKQNGDIPSSNNNPIGPVLDPASNNQSVLAIAGKYALVEPEIMSGYLAGYYVKVNGASDYFKVDYKNPRLGGKPKARISRHNKSLSKALNIDSVAGGNLDSSIVIVIPASIQPGQFCMTYCAYDSLGNVSNPIAVCINVLSFGGDAASSFLNASWHITGTSDDTTAGWEPVYGMSDTMYSNGYCINNHIVDSFGIGPVTYPAFIYIVTQADMTFGSNGGLKFDYAETSKEFNYSSSSCSNYVYNSFTDTDHMTGAWSYNSTTSKMVLIFDFDDMGSFDPEAYEYRLQKINNNKFYLHDVVGDEYMRLEK